MSMSAGALAEIDEFGVVTFPDGAGYAWWRTMEPAKSPTGRRKPKGFYFMFLEHDIEEISIPDDLEEWVAMAEDNEVNGPYQSFNGLFGAIREYHPN